MVAYGSECGGLLVRVCMVACGSECGGLLVRVCMVACGSECALGCAMFPFLCEV
jgi:hypothetical protein